GAVLLGSDWPSWRGPSNNGVSPESGLPVSWAAKCLDAPAATPDAPSEPPPAAAPPSRGGPPQQGHRGRDGRVSRGGREGRPIVSFDCDKLDTENVAWKIPLPAYSGSTPIVWGDTIFLNVATAANTGALELWAVDRRTQKVSWQRPLADTNYMQRKQN